MFIIIYYIHQNVFILYSLLVRRIYIHLNLIIINFLSEFIRLFLIIITDYLILLYLQIILNFLYFF